MIIHKIFYLVFTCQVFSCYLSQAQVTEFSSALPIIKIETGGVIIPDEPRIKANLFVIDSDGLNSTTDPSNESYSIEIETRGNSSLEFPKKSYRFETQDLVGSNLNVSILGLPAENDWILYAPYQDKSMIRNVLAYGISNKLGHYAPRTVFCEVLIDGYYQGIYVLTEKIKQDRNRVDIAKLTTTDISGDELTGGYILKVDWDDDENPNRGWTSVPENLLSGENPIYFQFDDPGVDVLLPVQQQYIIDHIKNFETAISEPDFAESKNYWQFIDFDSFIDHILLTEIAKNVDGYKRSVYLYKEKDSDGGKIKMGPIWDFDLAFGNVDYSENAQFAPGWMFTETIRMYWFRRLIQDPYFNSKIGCRWLDLRNNQLSDTNIISLIDSATTVLSGSIDRNFEQFPILGKYVWPNQFIGETYEEEINFLKDWLLTRLVWMDQNLPQECIITSLDFDNINQPNVFPNPFNDHLTIQFMGNLINYIQVNNLMGQEVFRAKSENSEFIWQGVDNYGNHLEPGVYLLTIKRQSGQASVHRVVLDK